MRHLTKIAPPIVPFKTILVINLQGRPPPRHPQKKHPMKFILTPMKNDDQIPIFVLTPHQTTRTLPITPPSYARQRIITNPRAHIFSRQISPKGFCHFEPAVLSCNRQSARTGETLEWRPRPRLAKAACTPAMPLICTNRPSSTRKSYQHWTWKTQGKTTPLINTTHMRKRTPKLSTNFPLTINRVLHIIK